MKIEKLKQQLKGYQVLINNQYYNVDEDTVVRYRLLSGEIVSENVFEQIKKLDRSYQDYLRCINYINYRIRSLHEIKQYLIKNKALDADFVIAKLTESGLINDETFSKMYVNDRINLSLDGPGKIISVLNNHNITMPEQYLGEYNDEFWLERSRKLIAKKMKTLKLMSAFNYKNKINTILNTQGYQKFTNVLLDELELNNDELLALFIDKIKHQEKETIIKKAQSAGFNYYEVVNYLADL